MKTLITIASLKKSGGAEKTAAALIRHLLKKGDDVLLLTFSQQGNNDEWDVGTRKICLNENGQNSLLKFIRLFSRSYAISKLCKKFEIERSISFMEEANFSNVLSRFFGNPARVIISIRTSIEKTYGPLYKKLISILYPFAHSIIPVSNEEKIYLLKNSRIQAKQIVVIPNGIKTGMSKEEYVRKKGAFVFIGVGRLVYQKGFDLLIEAFKLVHAKIKNTKLVILGEGDERKNLEALSSDYLGDAILIPGKIDNPGEFLEGCNCFVLSSRFEGFPNVILEAMVSGLPIISTDCKTGPKEILRKGAVNLRDAQAMEMANYGILVPSDDIEALSEAMIKMVTDSKTFDFYRKKSKERVENYSLQMIMKKWEML